MNSSSRLSPWANMQDVMTKQLELWSITSGMPLPLLEDQLLKLIQANRRKQNALGRVAKNDQGNSIQEPGAVPMRRPGAPSSSTQSATRVRWCIRAASRRSDVLGAGFLGGDSKSIIAILLAWVSTLACFLSNIVSPL